MVSLVVEVYLVGIFFLVIDFFLFFFEVFDLWDFCIMVFFLYLCFLFGFLDLSFVIGCIGCD